MESVTVGLEIVWNPMVAILALASDEIDIHAKKQNSRPKKSMVRSFFMN
jgi:hypothetical protein